MSFPVAVQSFAFYILACTPCHKWSAHRRADREADRQQKAHRKAYESSSGIVTEQPSFYPPPTIRMTNHWWKEDISMGPKLDKKAKKWLRKGVAPVQQPQQQQMGKMSSVTTTTTRSRSNTPSSTTTSATTPNTATWAVDDAPCHYQPPSPAHIPIPAYAADLKDQNLGADQPLDAQSSSSSASLYELEMLTEKYKSKDASQPPQQKQEQQHHKDKWRFDWNHIRYDREDEPLWGHETARAAGQRFKEVWADSSRRFGELNWMLQPPPHAKIMAGKLPVRGGEMEDGLER